MRDRIQTDSDTTSVAKIRIICDSGKILDGRWFGNSEMITD